MKPDKQQGRDKRATINADITHREVRLIDQNGEQVGIVPIREALAAAEAVELDLVEIVADAEPPVCRIMDYGKFVFEKKQQAKEAKKKQHQMQIKEIKLRPGTEEADYQVKLRNIIRFLEDGDKCKVTLRFRGREMAHQELGLKQLQRIEADLVEIGVVEQSPKIEGRMMGMLIGPKKKR
ncbi:MAG: translation initiation factor IF-3 [Moraxellaceae bacterium]|nr:translation initiation factor IF-3 [Moraxellaceae bacterium]